MNLFSFSRLNLYQTCPYRFYKRYVEGIEEPETYPLALGKGVHKAVEERLNGTDFQTAIGLGMLEANFHPKVTEKEISRLTNNAPIQNLIGSVQTELYFELPLSDEENAPRIRGYIDVVGNGFIVDWKTNRVPYNIRDNYQLMLYSWALSKLYGWNEVSATLYFLRFRRDSTSIFTLNDMEQARTWAYNVAKEIQAKVELVKLMPQLRNELFPATPQNFCSHCPIAYECHSIFSTLG